MKFTKISEKVAGLAVAPLAGAWIEIKNTLDYSAGTVVAPLAGAWIEIYSQLVDALQSYSRSPRGSVD